MAAPFSCLVQNMLNLWNHAMAGGALAAVIGLGCGSTGATSHDLDDGAARKQLDDVEAALTGVWERTLPGGESETLRLFGSHILAFQRSHELPISATVGRWFPRNGKLELEFQSCEGTCGNASPFGSTRQSALNPPRLVAALDVRHDGNRLYLTTANETTQWTRVAHPYGVGAGARERELENEKDWVYRLGLAEGKARALAACSTTATVPEPGAAATP
jgi:hypothetical protein